MFGTTDLDNINGLPPGPGFDPDGEDLSPGALSPQDLVARAKASISSASAVAPTGFGGMGGTPGWPPLGGMGGMSGMSTPMHGPATGTAPMDAPPRTAGPFDTAAPTWGIADSVFGNAGQMSAPVTPPPTAPYPTASGLMHHADIVAPSSVNTAGQTTASGASPSEILEEAEAEIKVRVKTGDLLYTRADLIMRRDNHLSAVVDGVLLDLGMISDELMGAMALAHQVHVSATHYMGGSIERRVPLVHH